MSLLVAYMRDGDYWIARLRGRRRLKPAMAYG
jgi:hypothetical protein